MNNDYDEHDDDNDYDDYDNDDDDDADAVSGPNCCHPGKSHCHVHLSNAQQCGTRGEYNHHNGRSKIFCKGELLDCQPDGG